MTYAAIGHLCGIGIRPFAARLRFGARGVAGHSVTAATILLGCRLLNCPGLRRTPLMSVTSAVKARTPLAIVSTSKLESAADACLSSSIHSAGIAGKRAGFIMTSRIVEPIRRSDLARGARREARQVRWPPLRESCGPVERMRRGGNGPVPPMPARTRAPFHVGRPRTRLAPSESPCACHGSLARPTASTAGHRDRWIIVSLPQTSLAKRTSG